MVQDYLSQSTNLQLLQATCKVHGAEMSPAWERRLQGELQILLELLHPQPAKVGISRPHIKTRQPLQDVYGERNGSSTTTDTHGVFQAPALLPGVAPGKPHHGKNLEELQTSKTWRLPWQVLAATSISQTCSLPRKGLDGDLTSKQGTVTEQTLSSPLRDTVILQHPAPQPRTSR